MRLLAAPASSPQTPSHSYNCVPPAGQGAAKGGASGGKGSGKSGGGHAGGKGAKSMGKGAYSKGTAAGVSPVKPASRNPNAWQRRMQAGEAAKQHASKLMADAAADDCIDIDDVENAEETEAQNLMEEMDTLQAMLNSLNGKQDSHAVSARAMLEKDLKNARIRKHQLKSLDAQMTIQEARVERLQGQCSIAEQKVEEATSYLMEVQSSLSEAQRTLDKVREAKETEDHAKTANNAPIVQEQQPQPQAVLETVQGWAQLLPPEKVNGFAECLQMIMNMVQAPPQQQVEHAVSNDSLRHVPQGLSFCGAGSSCGARSSFSRAPLEDVSNGYVRHDPYMESPSRRTRAHSAGQARSRSNERTENADPIMKCFSRREQWADFRG